MVYHDLFRLIVSDFDRKWIFGLLQNKGSIIQKSVLRLAKGWEATENCTAGDKNILVQPSATACNQVQRNALLTGAGYRRFERKVFFGQPIWRAVHNETHVIEPETSAPEAALATDN